MKQPKGGASSAPVTDGDANRLGKKMHKVLSVGVKDGVSEASGFKGESNLSLGLDNRGRGQVPEGTPKGSVSTDRGSFSWR